VFGDRRHELGDVATKAIGDLGDADMARPHDIVQQPGCHEDIGAAAVAQHPCYLERMRDVRRSVVLASLAGVTAHRELERRSGEWRVPLSRCDGTCW